MIIRVSRTDRTGRSLDHREAAKRIGRPAKYLGSKREYFIFDTPDPKTCAICTSDGVPLELQQLDPGGPLVAVCERCGGEPPSSGRYDFNGGRDSGAGFTRSRGGAVAPRRMK